MAVLTKAQVAALRTYDQDFNGRVNNKYDIPAQFADREYVISVLYDASVDGTITVDTVSGGVTLDTNVPIGAIISDIAIDIQTALTSTGTSSTLDIGFPAATVVESDGILVNNLAEASLAVGAEKPTLIPKKVSAVADLHLAAAAEKITAGKMRIFIKYYMARD